MEYKLGLKVCLKFESTSFAILFIKSITFNLLDIIKLNVCKYNTSIVRYTFIQGFVAVIFYRVDPDLLDTDPLENTIRFEISTVLIK